MQLIDTYNGIPVVRVDQPALLPFLDQRPAESHKGFYGHALLIAGSYGKMGAAVLAARACLRSGIGLLTVHVPRCGVDIMQTAVPEAMIDADKDCETFTSLPAHLERYDAVAIGPGLGTFEKTALAMERLLSVRTPRPLVVDADALNIIATRPTLFQHLKGALLTPHAMEFERLFGQTSNLIATLTQRAQQLSCHILYKGHHSLVAAPDGQLYQIATGNAGMATAGSGDVLTGIALGISAQHVAFENHGFRCSSIPDLALATYIHGKSGDISAQKLGMASIIASDIVDNISSAIHCK